MENQLTTNHTLEQLWQDLFISFGLDKQGARGVIREVLRSTFEHQAELQGSHTELYVSSLPNSKMYPSDLAYSIDGDENSAVEALLEKAKYLVGLKDSKRHELKLHEKLFEYALSMKEPGTCVRAYTFRKGTDSTRWMICYGTPRFRESTHVFLFCEHSLSSIRSFTYLCRAVRFCS